MIFRLRPIRRWLRLIGIFFLLFVAFCICDGWRAFGHRATGARRARMEHSPQWGSGHFVNPQPIVNLVGQTFVSIFRASHFISPEREPLTESVDPARFATPPPSGLRLTWLGHSTVLIEIDGHRVLTDPIFSQRVSPLGWIGPRRWFAPPLSPASLPPLDAVVISHDHYDHLDYESVVALRDRGVTFIVPLGVGAHLAYWGVPETRIIELDWWEHTRIGDLEITCTPARHASGRTAVDNDATLWASWAVRSPRHRVWYSGDTGLFPALREIGARLGPFDATMIEVGQYNNAWPDWHMGPEQAVMAHGMVNGRLMLPVHWATLALALHSWTEPIERALAAGQAKSATLVAPRPGQSFEPASPPAIERWWPEVPGRTAAEDPIVSSQMN
jgi:L-ascorbate metabolism protein UlaG (beta-lactamase superfamily)